MIKRTLQEFADFTGMYALMNKEHECYLSSIAPKLTCDNWIINRTELNNAFSLLIDCRLIIPFDGDWKESLHAPQEES